MATTSFAVPKVCVGTASSTFRRIEEVVRDFPSVVDDDITATVETLRSVVVELPTRDVDLPLPVTSGPAPIVRGFRFWALSDLHNVASEQLRSLQDEEVELKANAAIFQSIPWGRVAVAAAIDQYEPYPGLFAAVVKDTLLDDELAECTFLVGRNVVGPAGFLAFQTRYFLLGWGIDDAERVSADEIVGAVDRMMRASVSEISVAIARTCSRASDKLNLRDRDAPTATQLKSFMNRLSADKVERMRTAGLGPAIDVARALRDQGQLQSKE